MTEFIIIILSVIALETTYLVVKATRATKVSRRNASAIFVDTSVLIDGRIVEVAKSGFLTSQLYVPRSVIGELQLMADNGDSEKRARARHGLDIISELQAIQQLAIDVFDDNSKSTDGVDTHLLTLARKYNASILTIDYNLNKVAQVEGIQVLNINDLAKNLRIAYLPGEKIQLSLTQKGHDSHQAVGHLSDGTMVVVEQAVKLIGKTVEVEVTRSLQTAAGKMMFAKLVGQKAPVQSPKRRPAGRQETAVTNSVKTPPTRRKDNPASKRPLNHEDAMVALANKE